MATLQDVVDRIKESHGENQSRFQDIRDGQDETIRVQTATLNTLRTMLDISAEALTDAREAAREAARIKGDDDGGGDIPDGAKEEKKAGGFFSRMGKAIMNPIGSMGKSMKKLGKGVESFLTGLARGLAAFANPMVVLGVAAISVSLPIFAAGLAAAFKVFEMIAGQGKALEMITGIILSLGEAIGTILKKVLEGFGNMVRNMGPFITAFFDGVATVIKALHPIVVDIFKVIKDIITDPVLNKTIQEILKVLSVALQEISAIIQKVGDVIISVMENVSGILDSIFNGISKVISTIGDTIGGIIDSIVEGIERLAVLPAGNMLAVAAGLTAMAGALVLFSAGAAIAGAFMPSAEDLDKIATSVKKFADMDPGNLAQVGKGMGLVGVGLGAFGFGGAIADLLMPTNSAGMDAVAESVKKFGAIDGSNFATVGSGITALGVGLASFAGGGFLSNLSEGFGKLIGASDPVDKFKRFSEIGPGLNQAALGITGLAKAMNVLGDSDIEKTAEALDDFMDEVDMTKLKAFSSATEGLVSGQMLAQLQVQTAEAARTGRPIIIQSSTNTNVNNSSSAVLAGSPISTEDSSSTSKMQ